MAVSDGNTNELIKKLENEVQKLKKELEKMKHLEFEVQQIKLLYDKMNGKEGEDMSRQTSLSSTFASAAFSSGNSSSNDHKMSHIKESGVNGKIFLFTHSWLDLLIFSPNLSLASFASYLLFRRNSNWTRILNEKT